MVPVVSCQLYSFPIVFTEATCTRIRFRKDPFWGAGVSTRIVRQSGDPVHTDVRRAVCVKIIALLMWIWIKFYPCPHRPDARRLCQNYSAIHVDMDKIGLIHVHADEVRAVCVKIIALPIWIWIRFYPCPLRREARRSCQKLKFTKRGLCEYIIGHTTWGFHLLLFSYISYAAAFVRKRHAEADEFETGSYKLRKGKKEENRKRKRKSNSTYKIRIQVII